MKDLENCPFELSGSTATIALIVNNKVCYIINLGDNIAVICSKSNTKNEPIQLNKIHMLQKIKMNWKELKIMGEKLDAITFLLDAVTILLL